MSNDRDFSGIANDAEAIASAARRAAREVIAGAIAWNAECGDYRRLCVAVAEQMGIPECDVVRWVERNLRHRELSSRVSAARMDRQRAEYKKSLSVYFVRLGDAIKIGVTGNVSQRIRVLNKPSCLNPPELLHAIPGDESVEKEWHRRFASIRIRGEWFRAEPELLQAIEDVRCVVESR